MFRKIAACGDSTRFSATFNGIGVRITLARRLGSFTLKSSETKLSAPDLKVILKAVSWREESAPPVVAKTHKPGKTPKTSIQADPLHGLYAAQVDGKPVVQEFEPDPDLRDTEQVPGGTFLCVTHLRQEPYAVIPHVRICAVGEGLTFVPIATIRFLSAVQLGC